MFAKATAMLFVVCSILLSFRADASAESMTFRQCLQEAVSQSIELEATGMTIEMKENERKSMRGRFLPLVKLEGNVLYWDDKLEIEFDVSPMTDVFGELMADPIIQQMLSPEALQKAAELENFDTNIEVRDQLTYGATVTVAQPLTQLYRIYNGHKAAGSLRDSAIQDTVAKRREIEGRVVTAYLGLITAGKMVDSARATLLQIDAMEESVRALMEAEMIERNALLKVQVARADVQKKQFQAEKAVKLAAAALNMYMNRKLDTPIQPVLEDFDEFSDSRDLIEMQNEAVANRPEILSMLNKVEAANAGRHAAIGEMLPDINAVFQYQNSQGMGSMQPENVYFGGAVLSWNIWEWGTTWYKMKAAEVRAAQASTAIEAMRDGVALEVEARRLDVEEAIKEVGVARKQREHAAENLRIEQARYEVQNTSTTDLLEAQTADLRAKNSAVAAEMKLAQARYTLQLTIGRDLLEETAD